MSHRASLRCYRPVGAALAALTAVATLPLMPSTASAARTYWVPPSPPMIVPGHGFGHGHGMSQYGAEGAARAGKSSRQILDFYYPHTSRHHGGGRLRVLLTADTTANLAVRPAKRLRVRDLDDGATWRLPTRRLHATAWRITPTSHRAGVSAVQYRDRSGWQRWNLPGHRRVLGGDGQLAASRPLRLMLPGGAVRRYRGALRSASPHPRSSSRDTVNVVSLDQYVRSVLPAEMPSTWSMAALRAQAVAARTYAAWSRRAAGNRYWQVCDTTSCQVYAGAGVETARTDAAVTATAGTILRYRGRPAFTQFSSSSGGWTAAGGKPYLPARPDRWDGWRGNDYHDWRRRVGVRPLESRYPALGRLETIRVSRRVGHGAWGGRALEVVLRGSHGRVVLSGDDMRWALQLPSTWFGFEPTAIQRAWQRLGGAKSPLGRPDSSQRAVTSRSGRHGVAQQFVHGRMYWSARTGAHALLDGKILRAYARHHYVRGALGYPTTGVHRVRLGKRAKFQHGSITWVRASGRVRVHIRR